MLFSPQLAQVVPLSSPSAFGKTGRFFWESDPASLDFLATQTADPADILQACGPSLDEASIISSLLAVESDNYIPQQLNQSTLFFLQQQQLLLQQQRSAALQQAQSSSITTPTQADATIIDWPLQLLGAPLMHQDSVESCGGASSCCSSSASSTSGHTTNFDSFSPQLQHHLLQPKQEAAADLDLLDFELLDDTFASDTSSVSDGSLDTSPHHTVVVTPPAASATGPATSAAPALSSTKKTAASAATPKTARSGSKRDPSNPPPKRKRCPIMARKSRLERKRRFQMIVEHSAVLADTNKKLNLQAASLADEIAVLKARIIQRLASGALALPSKSSSRS